MNDFNILLKYLKRLGYPNKNILSLFKSLDYNDNNFLPDLVKNLGQSGADDFIQKTIDKLSTPQGIKIDLEEYGYPESYFYVVIINFRIDLEETNEAILVKHNWDEGGMIMKEEENKFYTLREVYQDCDINEWSDMLDLLERASNEFFFYNCGYGVWFEENRRFN
jgi:hypothetical protein